MAMSKRERERLGRILASLERGMAFTREVTPGQVEHCMRPDDPLAYAGQQSIAIVCKQIGSDFTLIRNARRELSAMLEPVDCEVF